MSDFYDPIKKCDLLLVSDSFNYQTVHTTLFCIIEGSVSLSPGQILESGTIFFCFPGTTSFLIDSHCVLLRLEWNNGFFLDELAELTNFPDMPLILDVNTSQFSVLKNYAHSRLTNSCPQFRTKALAFSILEQISASFDTSDPEFTFGTTRTEQLLNEILSYTKKNMTDFLSLSSVARHFSLTPQYLAGLFKKHCHITFQDYLYSQRSRKAEAYLRYTETPLETIIYKLHLKAFHPSPSSAFVETPDHTQQFSILSDDTALTYLHDFSQPELPVTQSSRHHSVTVSDKQSFLFPVWKQLINLGYAVNFNNPRIFQQLVHMQKCIGFRYGRICRIFDLVTTYSTNGKILYDFNPIFRILDVLINNHMYPFLELGNKRLRIQLNLRDSLVPDVPKDSEEYFHYVLKILPSFIRACINRYGYTSLVNWKFEVCFPNYESYGTIDDYPVRKYVDFFSQIRSCIHSYIPECQVGGPGFNNWGDFDSLIQLLTAFKSKDISVDFITAYLYPLHQTEHSFVLSSDPDILEKRMNQLKNVLKENYQKCDLWITEFNSNLSSRNYLNDSSYQASFIVHNIFAAIRCGIKAMGYYLMSDVPLYYADTFDMLFGGWGLFSNDSIPKPSFHALHLLSQLGTLQVLHSDRYLITRQEHASTSFECLFYHFQHLSPNCCNRNIEKDDFLHPDIMFQPQSADYWEITFPGLAPGYYLIHQYTLSPDQGNVLFQWYRLHFLTPDKAEDYATIQQLSEIPLDTDCLKVTGQKPLTIRFVLSRQEVRLVTVDYFHSLEKE